jgi:hypothetical protein
MWVRDGVHVMVKRRHGAKQARLPKEFKFPKLTGRQLQVWFLGVLHCELICRNTRYDRPRLSFRKEDDDILTVSDIPVVSNFAVTLDDGSHDFDLDIMEVVWPLKDHFVTWPPNLAEEDSNIRDPRLEDEKEKKDLPASRPQSRCHRGRGARQPEAREE